MELLGARPGEAWLVRPDARRRGRRPSGDPATLREALRRLLALVLPVSV
ncbi:MAG: hypothetical protein M3P93_12085 [Actinomycetota bacterium]|nr:hypothetical protein [Actinomycetota bacterium]